jgi:hypothetical protein
MKILDILTEGSSALATAKAKLAQLRADLKEFPSTTSSTEHAEAVEDINYKIKDLEKKIATLEGK